MSLVTSILTAGTNSHTTTAEEVNYVRTDFFSPGAVGTLTNTAGVAPATGSFAVNAQGTPDMTVAVSSGTCLVTATPSGGNSQLLRVKNSASANVTIAANSTGGTRYDFVYCKIDATAAANPAADASDVASLVTSRSTSATTDNGTPPTYGTLLAVVTVANGASSITNGNIADMRPQAQPIKSGNGWTQANETWTYSSYDSTNKTGVFTVPTDATTKYQPGMRVAFYQSSQQYGIITKVASTALTVYTGTDYSVANATVFNPQYSPHKAPFGFPLDPTKWTVTKTDSTDNSQTATGGTWYNLGSISISIPIGAWYIGYHTYTDANRSAATTQSVFVTLSTANNTESDTDFTSSFATGGASGTIVAGGIAECPVPHKPIVLTSATSYYLNYMAIATTAASGLRNLGSTYRPNVIRATCAYL